AIFFILSGIVLAAATESVAARHPVGLTDLVLKRWLRLGLPIVASGLVILLAFDVTGDRAAEVGWLTGSGWMRDLFPPDYHPHLIDIIRETIVGAFIGPQTPLHDPVLWTIRVEFLGSILVFALCLFVPGRARLAACAIAAAALIAAPAWLPNFCALFALGVAMHDLATRARRVDGRGRAAPLLRSPAADILGLTLLLLGACIYPVLDLHAPETMQRLGAMADPLGHMSQWTARSFLIVVGVMLSPTAQSFLANTVSQFLGRISFGLYLLHLPLLWSVGGTFYIDMSARIGPIGAAAIASLIVILSSCLAAAIFNRLIEAPSIRFAARASQFRLWLTRGAQA
ncbi:MAG: acyltransferase family protein, partial [Dongiaceae bacterium]